MTIHTVTRTVAVLAALLPAAVLAQGPGERHPRFGPPPFAGEGPEDGPGGKTVKGAPYKAEAVTQTTQTLADGNQIVRTMTATVFRDGEGRTRREMTGPAPEGAPDGAAHVLIHDPLAGAAYVLDPRSRTAFRLPPPGERGPRPHGPLADGPAGRRGPGADKMEAPQTTALGTQTIDGIEASGTRTTSTLPAGAIGNTRPIKVVSERWYSPELQVVLLATHSDPRFGVTTHRLRSLTRGEPDKSLFELPSDYTLRDGPPPWGGPRPGAPRERP